MSECLVSGPGAYAGARSQPTWIFIDCNSTLNKTSLAFLLLWGENKERENEKLGSPPISLCEQVLPFLTPLFLIGDYSFMNG